MKLKFAHISDLHYRISYQGTAGIYKEVLTTMDAPLLQMKSLMKEKPEDLDFVILTGDLCEFGSEEDYRRLKEELEEFFRVPIISTPGNHDCKKEYCHGFLGREEREPLVFSHIIRGLRILSLDSASETDNDGEITQAAVEKCKAILEEDSFTPTIVITHHHLLKEQFPMRIAKYPEEFAEVMKADCIKALFNGHTHHPYVSYFAGKPYFTAGCCSFVGEDEGEGRVGFYQNPSYSIVQYDGNSFDCQIQREKEVRYLTDIRF